MSPPSASRPTLEELKVMQQQSAAGKGAAKKNKKDARAKLDSASSSSSSGPNPLFGRRIVVGITLGEPYVRFSTRAKVAQTGNSRWGEGAKKIYTVVFQMICFAGSRDSW